MKQKSVIIACTVVLTFGFVSIADLVINYNRNGSVEPNDLNQADGDKENLEKGKEVSLPSEENDSGRTELLEIPNFSQSASCTHKSQAFCEAHLKFFKAVTEVLEKNVAISESDKSALNTLFSEAKGLFEAATSEPGDLFTRVYQAPNGIEAACIMLEVDDSALYPGLINMVPFTKHLLLRVLYDSLYQMSLLGMFDLPSECMLTYKDYKVERYRFVNCLYHKLYGNTFDRAFHELLNKALESPSENIQLQEVLKWWQSFRLEPIPYNYSNEFYDYRATDVKDDSSAEKYALSKPLNDDIDNWINGDQDSKNATEQHYLKTQMSKVFDLPPTLPLLISTYYTPHPNVIPIEQAVLNTPPRKLGFNGSCFTSSYFQSMANFLPLFKKFPGWRSVSTDPIFGEYKSIMERVACVNDSPLFVRSLMSWPSKYQIGGHPSHLHMRFLSHVASGGLALNQIFGMNRIAPPSKDEPDPRHYFPPYMLFNVTNGMPELEYLSMVGQLFICHLDNPHDEKDFRDPQYYEQPFELPLELSIRVIGSDQPKRFELYSFIMSQNINMPHVVSYVKRADGQWWLCDDFTTNSKVSTESLSNTAEKQRTMKSPYKQRPIMAFYLRTEQ